MSENLLQIVVVLIQGAGVILAVDFASGLLHWLEDSYGKRSWPVLGRWVIAPNVRHHFRPRAFTKTSFLQRNVVTILIAGVERREERKKAA